MYVLEEKTHCTDARGETYCGISYRTDYCGITVATTNGCKITCGTCYRGN